MERPIVLMLVLALGVVAGVAKADVVFGTPTNLGVTGNNSDVEGSPSISADGLSLYSDSFREGGHGGIDLWVATRETLSDPWQEPMNLGTAVNSLSGDSAPGISADGNVLFFSDFFDPRPSGQGNADIWMTMRATVSDSWGEPVNLGPAVNSSAIEAHPDISTDGSTLYFTSSRPGSAGFATLWEVSITPVVDFNGNGRVDGSEVGTMAHLWVQTTLCAISVPCPGATAPSMSRT